MPIDTFKYDKTELSRVEAGIITEDDMSKLNGVYIFVIEGCIQCWKLVEQFNFNNIDYSNWNFVQVLGNMTFFMEDMELEDMPTTRYYVDGEVKWEMFGVMFPPQIKKLQEAIAKLKKYWTEVS